MTTLKPLTARRTLIALIITLGAIGVAAVVFMLTQSLSPTAKAKAGLPNVLLPSLTAEQFIFVDNPRPTLAITADLMFIRTTQGELRAFEIPTINGKHAMPDRTWWRPGILCQKFEPNFEKMEFHCNDPAMPTSAQRQFRWTLNGKALAPHLVDDMVPVDGHIEESGYFVFSK